MKGRTLKRDANEAEIVEALRILGASVEFLSDLGAGVPDLLVGFRGKNYIMEVKNPKTGGKLNQRQVEWHAFWRGQVAVVQTTEEALEVMRGLD